MRTCYFYWLFEPLRDELHDDGARAPAFEVPVHFENDPDPYSFALFFDGEGVPEFARLAIPRLSGDEIPDRFRGFLQSVGQHLLTVLRLQLDRDASYEMSVWHFVDYGAPPQFRLHVSQEFGRDTVDVGAIRDFFGASLENRQELRLLLDATDEDLPLQYRFLSLYKIFELCFRSADGWREEEFAAAVSAYESDFRAAGVTKSPVTHVRILRDRCAHHRGRGKTFEPVNHLSVRSATEVEKILPIVTRICIDVINVRVQGRFVLGYTPPTAGSW